MARGAHGGTPKKGKKNRKHGRNEKFCQKYEAGDQRMKNKKRKVARHLRKHPNDEAGWAFMREHWPQFYRDHHQEAA